MSQSSGTETTQPLGTTSARLVAVRLKSANKHIFRALLSLASVNLLIRIMGLFNQIVVTALFGQGAAMDAYYAAWTLPNTLAQLLASGLEASVIPVYSGVHAKATPEHSSRLFSTLLNLLLLGLIPFTILMIVFRHQMIIFAAPGLHESSMQLSIDLAPFIFPMLLFMTLNSFMEYLLNTKGQFGWPAYAGILVPLTTVTCILLAGRQFGVVMLAIGTLGGQVLQLIAILYRAHRAKFVYRPVLDLRLPELAAIGLVAWPALFGALIGQASPLVDQIFSSTLAVGSIAVLTNANKLLSVPVGVIFSSVGRAVLPFLSSQAAMKDMKAFKETLRLYLWAVGIGTVGLTAFMIVMAHPMVQILFQHGAFSAEDTDRTATTLVGFVIGLTPMAFGFITSRAFSALGKTKILMYISIFSVFANAGFDYIFGKMWGSFGIALATSAVYFCTMFILLFTLRRLIGKLYLFTPPREVLTVLWRLGLGQYYVRWVIWKEENLTTLHIPYDLSKRLVRLITALVIFGVGIAATIINTTYALTIAFGSLVVLAFMRYRYALLLTWVAVNALIGSTIPLFNGNHFLSGLTVPTLLLMLVVPIKPAFKRMPEHRHLGDRRRRIPDPVDDLPGLRGGRGAGDPVAQNEKADDGTHRCYSPASPVCLALWHLWILYQTEWPL
jgi:murein biosynthesis integral membrane protein MurJ